MVVATNAHCTVCWLLLQFSVMVVVMAVVTVNWCEEVVVVVVVFSQSVGCNSAWIRNILKNFKKTISYRLRTTAIRCWGETHKKRKKKPFALLFRWVSRCFSKVFVFLKLFRSKDITQVVKTIKIAFNFICIPLRFTDTGFPVLLKPFAWTSFVKQCSSQQHFSVVSVFTLQHYMCHTINKRG